MKWCWWKKDEEEKILGMTFKKSSVDKVRNTAVSVAKGVAGTTVQVACTLIGAVTGGSGGAATGAKAGEELAKHIDKKLNGK